MIKEFTIRNIGKVIGDFFSNAFNAVLDFDLTPILFYGFTVVILVGGPVLIFIRLKTDIAKWKTYHIGQKIMYQINYAVLIFFYCLFSWLFLFG
jgi:hypothetical protein